MVTLSALVSDSLANAAELGAITSPKPAAQQLQALLHENQPSVSI